MSHSERHSTFCVGLIEDYWQRLGWTVAVGIERLGCGDAITTQIVSDLRNGLPPGVDGRDVPLAPCRTAITVDSARADRRWFRAPAAEMQEAA